MNVLSEKSKFIVIILNSASVIMGILGLISAYNSYVYISGLVERGLDINDQLVEIINAYSTAVTPYVFYIIVLITLGYIIKQMKLNEDIDTIEEEFMESYIIDDLEL